MQGCVAWDGSKMVQILYVQILAWQFCFLLVSERPRFNTQKGLALQFHGFFRGTVVQRNVSSCKPVFPLARSQLEDHPAFQVCFLPAASRPTQFFLVGSFVSEWHEA